MSEDDFRKNVYEVLKAVEAKTMSLSVAQRRIMRLARRVTPNKSVQPTLLESGQKFAPESVNPYPCDTN